MSASSQLQTRIERKHTIDIDETVLSLALPDQKVPPLTRVLSTRRRRVLPLTGESVLENAVETLGLGDVSVDTVGDLFRGVSVEVVGCESLGQNGMEGVEGILTLAGLVDWVWQVLVPLISKHFLPTLA
jgi:hypothetical protein